MRNSKIQKEQSKRRREANKIRNQKRENNICKNRSNCKMHKQLAKFGQSFSLYHHCCFMFRQHLIFFLSKRSTSTLLEHLTNKFTRFVCTKRKNQQKTKLPKQSSLAITYLTTCTNWIIHLTRTPSASLFF